MKLAHFFATSAGGQEEKAVVFNLASSCNKSNPNCHKLSFGFSQCRASKHRKHWQLSKISEWLSHQTCAIYTEMDLSTHLDLFPPIFSVTSLTSSHQRWNLIGAAAWSTYSQSLDEFRKCKPFRHYLLHLTRCQRRMMCPEEGRQAGW